MEKPCSIKFKKNICPLETEIDTSLVYYLEPVAFTFVLSRSDTYNRNIGLVAEQVDEFFPMMVPKDDGGQPRTVDYAALTVVLLAEMKKLRERVTFLENQMEEK
jgi:hypothetical protein